MRTFYVLLACGWMLAVYVAYRADQANRGTAAPGQMATSLITGTWKADSGALFQFRSDGTGRSRNPENPQAEIHYFEWKTDGTDFTIYWAPRGRLRNLIAHMTAVETGVFVLENVTDDGFTLAETPQVKTRFERTSDMMLDGAH